MAVAWFKLPTWSSSAGFKRNVKDDLPEPWTAPSSCHSGPQSSKSGRPSPPQVPCSGDACGSRRSSSCWRSWRQWRPFSSFFFRRSRRSWSVLCNQGRRTERVRTLAYRGWPELGTELKQKSIYYFSKQPFWSISPTIIDNNLLLTFDWFTWTMSDEGNLNASKLDIKIFSESFDFLNSLMIEVSAGQPRSSMRTSSVLVAPSMAIKLRTKIS